MWPLSQAVKLPASTQVINKAMSSRTISTSIATAIKFR
jgi:hypothetical protein